MGIDIWYDSDEEAKESTNVQEYEDSDIIVYNVKAASQEIPQLNSKKQITKMPPPLVNLVTHSGRLYQSPDKEKDISKGKEMPNDTISAKEEDDIVRKQIKKTQA